MNPIKKHLPPGWLSDEDRIIIQYEKKLGRIPDLKNPKRYTEKLQWYKLHYRKELLTQCADKYRVRDYIMQKGLSQILIPLYGAYDSVDEIPFDALPDRFAMKANHASGTNILCYDKKHFNEKEARQKGRQWLNRDFYKAGREWAYKNIKRKIVFEELLVDNENETKSINDYKFLCLNGQVTYVLVDMDRFGSHKRNIYTPEWKFLDIRTNYPNCGDILPKPENFEEMKAIAGTLAEDFPHVRVDLYSVNGKAYFGELTFYPWSGFVQFTPDSFDFELGEKLKLPSTQ